MTTDDSNPTPAAPAPRFRPRELALGLIGIIVVGLLIAGVTAARQPSGERSGAAEAGEDRPHPRAAHPASFTVSGIEANGTALPTQPVVDAVLGQLNSWANAGVLDPVRSGLEPPLLEQLFTTAARPAAATTDRATLFAIGLPRAETIVDTATAHLHTVAGPDAGTAVVVASVDLRLLAQAGEQRLRIVRTGEVVLIPEADGVWRIDGWRLHAAEEPL